MEKDRESNANTNANANANSNANTNSSNQEDCSTTTPAAAATAAAAATTTTVDEMMSKLLLKMNVADRNSLYEEMHGVRCRAVEEDPALVRTSLLDFQAELDRIVGSISRGTSTSASASPSSSATTSGSTGTSSSPVSTTTTTNTTTSTTNTSNASNTSFNEKNKDAYIIMLSRRRTMMEAANKSNSNKNTTTASTTASTSTTANTTTTTSSSPHNYHYALDDPDFRLRFLRCELFDVPRAVHRFWTYLNHVHDLWGDTALHRPIGMQDLLHHTQDRRYLKKGYAQVLPFRDNSGRRIFTFMGGGVRDVHPDTLSRVVFFLLDSCTRDCPQSQRAGTVVVVELHRLGGLPSAELFSRRALVHMARNLRSVPTRLVTQHICLPDSLGARVLANLFVTQGYGNAASKKTLLFHEGTELETRYKVRSFGVPVHLFPLTKTGNVKLVSFHQWIKVRVLLEGRDREREQLQQQAQARQQQAQTNANANANTHVTIVECPCVNDVVFRRGTPSWDNPGNAAFRGLMLDHFRRKAERQRLRDNNGDTATNANANANTNAKEDQIFCDWLMDQQHTTTQADPRGRFRFRFLEWQKNLTWVHMESDTKDQKAKIRHKISIAIYNFGRNWKTTSFLFHNTNNNGNGNGNASRRRRSRTTHHTAAATTTTTTTTTTNDAGSSANAAAHQPARMPQETNYGNISSSSDTETSTASSHETRLRYAFMNGGQRPGDDSSSSSLHCFGHCMNMNANARKRRRNSGDRF